MIRMRKLKVVDNMPRVAAPLFAVGEEGREKNCLKVVKDPMCTR